MDWQKNKEILLQEMNITKGARFNATERLKKRDRNRTYITSSASVAVIILTVFPLIFRVPEIVNSSVNFLTIDMSVVILVYSLLQYSSGDLVAADQHYRCALEINALKRQLRNTENTNEETINGFAEKYDEILLRYGINYEPIDFEAYKLDHLSNHTENSEEKLQILKDIRKSTRAEDYTRYAITSVIASVFGFATILVAYYSYIDTKEMKESLMFERDAQERAQQALLTVNNVILSPIKPEIGKPLNAVVTVRNDGGTRADAVSMESIAAISPRGEQPHLQIKGSPVSIGVLPAGHNFSELAPIGESSGANLKPEVFDQLMSGNSRIYVIGRVTYLDFLGHRHRVEFCQKFAPSFDGQTELCQTGNTLD